MHFLQVLLQAFWTVQGWLWQIFVAFGSYWGVDKAITKYAVYAGIIVLLMVGPFGVSKRDKRTAKRVASTIVDVTNHLRK